MSDDGRYIAFQVPRVGLAAGVGEGLYILDLARRESTEPAR